MWLSSINEQNNSGLDYYAASSLRFLDLRRRGSIVLLIRLFFLSNLTVFDYLLIFFWCDSPSGTIDSLNEEFHSSHHEIIHPVPLWHLHDESSKIVFSFNRWSLLVTLPIILSCLLRMILWRLLISEIIRILYTIMSHFNALSSERSAFLLKSYHKWKNIDSII